MQIFVQASRPIVVEVAPQDMVARVMDAVEASTGVPCRLQRLQFGMYIMEPDRTLSDYNVRPGATLRLHVGKDSAGEGGALRGIHGVALPLPNASGRGPGPLAVTLM
jgi:hypothetical protein